MKNKVAYRSPSGLKIDFADMAGCPVREGLGTLGRKWALLVLRNIGFYRIQRFNDMLNSTPGMTQRALAMRLKELKLESLRAHHIVGFDALFLPAYSQF